MKFKTTILSLLLTLCVGVGVAQNVATLTPQQANDRVSGYISGGDYGTLSRELPALREAVVPHLLLLAEALVAYHEGRHAESNAFIDQLAQYEKELGGAVIVSMNNIAYFNALALEQYAEAGEYLKAVAQSGDEAQRQTTACYQQWVEAMAKRKTVKVKKSKRDKMFAIESRNVGDGSHLVVEAKVGRQSVDMIFDTGCCFANCITEEAAQRLGVKVVLEELPINGVAGSNRVKVGVLPKMKIGDVVVKNASFFIMDKIVDSPASGKIEAALGTHVLRALGEMVLDVDKGEVTLPAVKSQAPETRNLSYHTGNYGIELGFNWRTMVAHLDSGANRSHLSTRFYNEHRTMLNSIAATRRKIKRSGVGGSEEIEVLSAPGIGLNVGDKLIIFNPIDVYLRGGASSWYGVMGVDFLQSAGKVTLDLERMFLRIE